MTNTQRNIEALSAKKSSSCQATLIIPREQIISEINNLKELIFQHSVISWDKHILWRNIDKYSKSIEEIIRNIDWVFDEVDWLFTKKKIVEEFHDYWLRVFAYENHNIIQMCNLPKPWLNNKDKYSHVELNMTANFFYIMNSPIYMRKNWDSYEVFDFETISWKITSAKKFYKLYQETIILIWKNVHSLIDKKMARELKKIII